VDAAVGDVISPRVDDTGERRDGRGEASTTGSKTAAPTVTDRGLLAAVLLAVNVPIMVAVARALARGWQPLGDNGILLVRARDVGTRHNPLLGSWTSASLVLGENVNNPGPLYFDAVAPAVRLLGPWVGAAVGVMLINMAAATLAVVVARRIAGAPSMIGVAVAVVGLEWALGSELLFDMWQPNALVLPFFAFIVVAAALATGDLAMAPWVAGVGSFVVQTHMSHAALVAALTVAATVLCVVALRRSDRDDPVRWRRPMVWAVVVAGLAWSQPLVEQLTGTGKGNLSRIAGAATSGADPIGGSAATRLLAEITVAGPWFTRETYAEAVPFTVPGQPVTGIVGIGGAVLIQAAVLLALGAVGLWAARTARRAVATLAAVAVVALGCSWVALAVSPVNQMGLTPHQMRWLWPVAAFITAVGVTAVLSARWPRPAVQPQLLVVGAAFVVVAAVGNIPTHRSASSGPIDTADHLRAGQELMGQLGPLEGRGTILYDPTVLMFAEPYSGMTFAELQDRGIPFVFDDEGFIRQFGEGRRNDGSADLRLWQAEGAAALDVPPGAERVALAEGPSGPVALFVEPVD
jgi:hypothetical protein